jgi:hypothetical protein
VAAAPGAGTPAESTGAALGMSRNGAAG